MLDNFILYEEFYYYKITGILSQDYNIECVSREIKVLSELRSDRVVRYMKTWIDNNNSLYIQMEFCSDNLKNILNTKELVFNRNKHSMDTMSDIQYHISCNIFIEIIEAVYYLHNQTPPIMHRDLKPANILFDEKGENNGVFFKLADFGLAKLYDRDTNTAGQGTHRYMAPEVWDGRYGPKADVYSLGIIGQKDIFGFTSEKYSIFILINN